MAKTNTPAPRNVKAAEARRRAQAQVRAQQRRTTALWTLGAIVLVAIFAALVAFIIRQNGVGAINQDGQVSPAAATADYALPVGDTGVVGESLDDSRVRLDIYFDFMCPVCNGFEQLNGDDIDALRTDGTVDVYYHPIAILDDRSLGTNYSTRSASAAALVADKAPAQFLDFFRGLYANQPQENTRGLSDGQIQQIARAAGVSEDVVGEIPNYAYARWVGASTEAASLVNAARTPTIFINGVNQASDVNPDGVNWSQPGNLRAAIEAAAAS